MKYKMVTLMTHFIVVDTGGIGCACIADMLRPEASSFVAIIFVTCTFVARRAWSASTTHWASPLAQSCASAAWHPAASTARTATTPGRRVCITDVEREDQ